MVNCISSWFFENLILLLRGTDLAGQKGSIKDHIGLEHEVGGTETRPGKGKGRAKARTCRHPSEPLCPALWPQRVLPTTALVRGANKRMWRPLLKVGDELM